MSDEHHDLSSYTTEQLLEHLRPTVFAGACAAWDQLRAEHPNDHWYGFGLYTSDEAAYLVPTASSEEGLDVVARRYVERSGGSFPAQRASLRWSPCDSPYHCIGQEHFEATNTWLAELNERWRAAVAAGALDLCDAITDAIFALCRDVLRQMDTEGRFGRGDERAAIALNVLKGDQSDEERLAWASELNPPAVGERLKREFEESIAAYYEIRDRGPDEPSV